MKKFPAFLAAACLAAVCLSVAAAPPVYADQTAVVGGAPGEESQTNGTERQSTGIGQSGGNSGETLVPMLPIETKVQETSAAAPAPEEQKTVSAPTPDSSAPPATSEAPPLPVSTAAGSPAGSGTALAGTSAGSGSAAGQAAAPVENDESKSGPSKLMVAGGGSGVQEPVAMGEETARASVGPGISKGVSEPVVSRTDPGYSSGTSANALAGTTDWSRVSDQRKRIVDMAKSFIGGTYTYGGTTPESGFDCSGFVMYIMKEAAGISLYHQSARQAQSGSAVSASEMQPGDIIAYDGSPKDGVVNHVSIYVGDGQAVHAVGTGKGIRMTDWDYSEPFTIRNVVDD